MDRKSPAERMKLEGWRPNFPIAIIPGFASSSLRVEQGDQAFQGKRLWINIKKIGLQKVFGIKKKEKKDTKQKKKDKNEDKSDDEEDNDDDQTLDRRGWIKHMCLGPECSDPEGIRVRPYEGLEAVKHLCPGFITADLSYVFGPLIKSLQQFGYDNENLRAYPYDWRIPAAMLETRDKYFEDLKRGVEELRSINRRRVIFLTHSMGGRVLHWFLNKIKQEKGGQEWIDKNVESMIAIGVPWLGAPKSIRSLISGERMGLEDLLFPYEGVIIGRSWGSGGLVFPVGLDKHWRHKQFTWMKEGDEWVPKSMEDILSLGGCKEQWRIYDKYFLNHSCYGKQGDEIISAPPISKMHVIYGVNSQTEAFYFFEKSSQVQTPRSIADTMITKRSSTSEWSRSYPNVQNDGSTTIASPRPKSPRKRNDEAILLSEVRGVFDEEEITKRPFARSESPIRERSLEKIDIDEKEKEKEKENKKNKKKGILSKTKENNKGLVSCSSSSLPTPSSPSEGNMTDLILSTYISTVNTSSNSSSSSSSSLRESSASYKEATIHKEKIHNMSYSSMKDLTNFSTQNQSSSSLSSNNNNTLSLMDLKSLVPQMHDNHIIINGIGYEVQSQQFKSGDGTVPYDSLAYCKQFMNSSVDVNVVELDKVDHRDILKDIQTHRFILGIVGKKYGAKIEEKKTDEIQTFSVSSYSLNGPWTSGIFTLVMDLKFCNLNYEDKTVLNLPYETVTKVVNLGEIVCIMKGKESISLKSDTKSCRQIAMEVHKFITAKPKTDTMQTVKSLSNLKVVSNNETSSILINVVEGRSLAIKDCTGSSDPYCVIRLQDDRKSGKKSTLKKFKTIIIDQDLNPVWDQHFSCPLEDIKNSLSHYSLHVEVWDHDTFTASDFMGQFYVPLSDMVLNRMNDSWYMLQKRKVDDYVDGQIRLQIKITPEIGLKELELEKQSLSSGLPPYFFSSFWNQYCLQKLSLVCCDLKSIPPELSSFTLISHINLSNNQITQIPNDLSSLTELVTFILQGNKIPIDSIPKSILKLSKLEQLDIRCNSPPLDPNFKKDEKLLNGDNVLYD